MSLGPPGVGKTLTAECIADLYERPLYTVTSGDIGTDPKTVELKLAQIFLHAVNWNAVLLLDEADVFLAERDLEKLERNALVSGKTKIQSGLIRCLQHADYTSGSIPSNDRYLDGQNKAS